MGDELQELVVEDVPCFDPECSGIAEAEVDGEHRYYECLECGSTFGYERVIQPEGDCALGVPESVRKMASLGDIVAESAPTPVTIRGLDGRSLL